LKTNQIPVFDLNASSNLNGSFLTAATSNSFSIDNIKTNEMPTQSEDSNCTSAADLKNKLNRFITDLNDPDIKSILNGSIPKIVTDDYSVLMDLSNQISEIKRIIKK